MHQLPIGTIPLLAINRPDGYNFSADQSKPAYDTRLAFTTCTDYRASIMQVARTRAFQCFTSPIGDFNSQTSAMAGAADKTTTFQKY